MIRLKSYKHFKEAWLFGKKEKKRMSSKEFIEWVTANYKDFKKNKNYYFFI